MHGWSVFPRNPDNPVLPPEQDDNEKYYIKNESDDRGLVTSYLVEQKSGTVKWVDMGSDEVVANDSAAWYVSFTPDNQYYQFRIPHLSIKLSFSHPSYIFLFKSHLFT